MSYISFPRSEWATLPNTLNMDQVTRTPDLLSKKEIEEVYGPLVSLLGILYENQHESKSALQHFFNRAHKRVPFLIGIAGSVSAGKSTFAEALASLLTGLLDAPQTTIVSTDQFLYKTAILEEKGLMDLKGFPESYDWEKLYNSLKNIKKGNPTEIPIYSHVFYDILPDETQRIEQPDILIVEGINALQTGGNGESLHTLFDMTLYLDAEEEDLLAWFWQRVLGFKEEAKDDPTSYYYAFRDMTQAELQGLAKEVWNNVNGKNLHEHILPTRERADIILKKALDHTIREIKISDVLL